MSLRGYLPGLTAGSSNPGSTYKAREASVVIQSAVSKSGAGFLLAYTLCATCLLFVCEPETLCEPGYSLGHQTIATAWAAPDRGRGRGQRCNQGRTKHRVDPPSDLLVVHLPNLRNLQRAGLMSPPKEVHRGTCSGAAA